ncbi:MAG: hypothetical protein MJD61_12910, partial [Proteobacteria bacterium]|nr:hypothetical protein [Pseudomonadota bacterium]
AGQPNIIATPADRVRRWEACLLGVDWDGPLVSGERFKIEEVLGEPVPDPDLNMASSCDPCAAHHAIGDPPRHPVPGTTNEFLCGECLPRQVAQGRICVDCPFNLWANHATDTCECCPPGQILGSTGNNVCEVCPLGQGGDCVANSCVWCPVDFSVDAATELGVPCPEAQGFGSGATQSDQAVCPDVWIEVQHLPAIADKPTLDMSATASDAASLDEATCIGTTVGYDVLRPDGSGGWQLRFTRQSQGVFGTSGCTFSATDSLDTSTLPTAIRIRIHPPSGGTAATTTQLRLETEEDERVCGGPLL